MLALVPKMLIALGASCALAAGETPIGQPLATAYAADHNASEIVFVNHKAGIASGFMEDTLVHPAEWAVDIRVGDTYEALSFTITIPVEALVVGDRVVGERAYPRLHELSLLTEPIDDIPDRRKRRIYKGLLDDDRLDAENHPYIVAETQSVKATDSEGDYRVTTDVTIRGVTRTAEWPARIYETEDELIVETWGSLRFTDFGMEEFSIMLGAIRYEDEFDVYARLNARPVSDPEASKE